ncbi:MAG: invasion associated locus B family protein [Sphingobium sp.]
MLGLSMLGLSATAPAQARDSLGIFDNWGAFRDPATPRCYAIARPRPPQGSNTVPKGFATVATWPRHQVRGQVHFRLSRARAANAPVTLNVGDRRFPLVAGKSDAWARDPRADAAIVAAMRAGISMSVQTTSAAGRGFADTYALRGAATAIDAAALGCAKLR